MAESIFKKGDTVIRRDGQVGIVDSDVNPTTGRVWVIFDTERPARYTEASKLTKYEGSQHDQGNHA